MNENDEKRSAHGNLKQQSAEPDSAIGSWRSFEECRPDELELMIEKNPLIFLPLGLIEHHGWHLPVGFDGIKARRFCEKIADSTGGLIMPVVWWGALGGHGSFKWTFYQEPGAARSIVVNTIEKLVENGGRIIVLMMGHYPWEGLLNANGEIDALRNRYPDVRIIAGTEVSICEPGTQLPEGDHAARQETDYGLYLLPELVNRDALTGGRSENRGFNADKPAKEAQFPGVVYDSSHRNFAQMGEDPRLSNPEEAKIQSETVIASVIKQIKMSREELEEK